MTDAERAFLRHRLPGTGWARHLGLDCALPVPSACLPDPDLSEIHWGVPTRRRVDPVPPARAASQPFRSMPAVAGGRNRPHRAQAPA